jgi:hypothetical protein
MITTENGTVKWTGEYPHGATAELLLETESPYSIGNAPGCGGSLKGNLYSSSHTGE